MISTTYLDPNGYIPNECCSLFLHKLARFLGAWVVLQRTIWVRCFLAQSTVFTSALGQATCESWERTACDFCEPPALHGSADSRQATLGEIWLLPD